MDRRAVEPTPNQTGSTIAVDDRQVDQGCERAAENAPDIDYSRAWINDAIAARKGVGRQCGTPLRRELRCDAQCLTTEAAKIDDRAVADRGQWRRRAQAIEARASRCLRR